MLINMIQSKLVQLMVNFFTLLKTLIDLFIICKKNTNFFSGTDTYPHDHGIVRAMNAHYKPNNKIIGNPRHTIFIGRLHFKTDEDTLKYKFRKFGKIKHCRIVRDLVTGKSKQYAFIEFDSSPSVRDAIRYMNKCFIDDCEIIVDYEHERLMTGWKPRRLGGGFGGQKESGQLRFGGYARPFQKPFDNKQATTSNDLKEVFRLNKSTKHLN